MDEGAAAAFTGDGGEGRPHSEDDQNYIKAIETADSKYLDTFTTNCEESECLDTPMLITLTSACFAAISPVCPPLPRKYYCLFKFLLMHTL